jgi:hypothetical protein
MEMDLDPARTSLAGDSFLTASPTTRFNVFSIDAR